MSILIMLMRGVIMKMGNEFLLLTERLGLPIHLKLVDLWIMQSGPAISGLEVIWRDMTLNHVNVKIIPKLLYLYVSLLAHTWVFAVDLLELYLNCTPSQSSSNVMLPLNFTSIFCPSFIWTSVLWSGPSLKSSSFCRDCRTFSTRSSLHWL